MTQLPLPTPHPGPVRGNAAAGLGALLAGLGVAPAAARDTVEDLIRGALTVRGMTANIAALRYGTLVLACDPQTAALLRYDSEHLLEELNTKLEEPLTAIRVKVARTR